MNKSKSSICKSYIEKNNHSSRTKEIVKNLNLSAETANLIAILISNQNISNLPELNFVVNMLSNLNKKLGYTGNQKRKSELISIIEKLDELKNQMINENKKNKDEPKNKKNKDELKNKKNKDKLKEIINEIEKFYLGTRRKKNSTRDYFYEQLELLYKCQENNKSIFAKRLRKLLLNKKLSYSNMGQIFSPRSKNRKGKVINFLQKNNGKILDMTNNNGEIQKFYKNSKKNNNKKLYKKFKENYNEFSRKEEEKRKVELEKARQKREGIEEKYPLQSGEEKKEEKKIKELISALNAFIETAKIKGISLQGSNKKRFRKELRDNLKKQVELLQKYINGTYEQNETPDKTIEKIQELFKNYNEKKKVSKWTNGNNTTNKRKKVENLLTHNPSTTVVGGSMYVIVKGVGKRKLRYHKNGKKYVLVEGEKVSI